MTDIIGTVEEIGTATTQAGKPCEWLVLLENKQKYRAFKKEISIAGVKQDNKVRFTTWDDKGLFIDQIEVVPETTQTTVEAPSRVSTPEQTVPSPNDREAIIEFLAVLKAVAPTFSLDIMISDSDLDKAAKRIVQLAEKVIALRKKER